MLGVPSNGGIPSDDGAAIFDEEIGRTPSETGEIEDVRDLRKVGGGIDGVG